MSLVLLITSLLSAVVQGTPQISSTIKQIIMDIYGSLSAVINSGVVENVSASTVLAALAGVIVVLKNDPNLPADKLVLVESIEKMVAAGLAADKEAQKGVDTTKLQPIEPLS